MEAIRAIITRCGGDQAVAEAISTGDTEDIKRKRWAVQKWTHNGIPEKHWATLRSMGDVSVSELHAANQAVREAA